ncbi:MAG: Ig-like domain-containing protein [Nitrososphaeraceae archaeon]
MIPYILSNNHNLLNESYSIIDGSYKYFDYGNTYNIISIQDRYYGLSNMIDIYNEHISKFVINYERSDKSTISETIMVIPKPESKNYFTQSPLFKDNLKYDNLYNKNNLLLVGSNKLYSNPIAYDGNATVVEGKSVEIQLTATDNNPDDILRLIIVTDPSKGQLSEINREAGIVTYTPNKDIVGPDSDSFTFKVNDGTLDSENATITIDIQPIPNNPPIAYDGNATVVERKSVEIEFINHISEYHSSILFKPLQYPIR